MPRNPVPIPIKNLQNKHKHHLFPFCNGAKGRQEGSCPPDEVCVERGLEVNPVNTPIFTLLGGQDVGDEVVPVKEPAMSERVQDVKNGRLHQRRLGSNLGNWGAGNVLRSKLPPRGQMQR